MKRYIAIVLSVLMILQTVGCNKAKDLFPENTASGGTSQTESVDEKGMKVGFIFPRGTDATDTISRVEGIRKMQFETGLKDSQVQIKTDVSKEECEDQIDKLVEEGCNIIFTNSSTYESTVLEAASKYPNVQFCQEDGKKAKNSGLSNMHNYYVRLYEGYYAAGVAAGMKLNALLNSGRIESGNCVIGFVANKEDPETTSCINAFYLGVGEVCSQASMMVRYADSTGVYDDDGECAKQLVEAGVGLMAQFTATTAVAAVCAENDIPIVGNDVNIIDVAPSEALTSAVADWSVYYTYAVNCLLKGKAIDTDWCGGYKEGAVTLTQLNDKHLADGTVEKLIEVENSLKSGKAKVFDTEKFTVNGKSLESLVEEDDDFKGYKKYIKNGEYQESEKRSAPSMEFFVDGVEESTYDYLEEENSTEEDTEETDSIEE